MVDVLHDSSGQDCRPQRSRICNIWGRMSLGPVPRTAVVQRAAAQTGLCATHAGVGAGPARSRLPEQHWVLSSLESFEPGGEFAAVIAWDSLFHIPLTKRLHCSLDCGSVSFLDANHWHLPREVRSDPNFNPAIWTTNVLTVPWNNGIVVLYQNPTKTPAENKT